ncbi:MAG: PaaI family thioesterase [Actinomycetota bacterium]
MTTDAGDLLNPPEITHCFVCGSDNESGLGLHVFRDGTDAVATWTPDERFQGWPDRLHGGIVGLLVDEMLVYAGAPHDLWGMTAKVRYWLRKPVRLEGSELTLRGRLIQKSDRGFRAVVSIHEGEVLVAEGEGMCVLLPDSPRPE